MLATFQSQLGEVEHNIKAREEAVTAREEAVTAREEALVTASQQQRQDEATRDSRQLEIGQTLDKFQTALQELKEAL